jgi:hypothetical protein
MLKYHLFSVVLGLSFIVLSACTTSSPVKIESETRSGNETTSYELVVAREREVLAAAYEAIQKCFPYAGIWHLSGNEKGFKFSTQPFIDNPTYKFVTNKVYGRTSEGNDIVGYRFFIHGNGQLLPAEAEDVRLLTQEFKRTLAEKEIPVIHVVPVESGR